MICDDYFNVYQEDILYYESSKMDLILSSVYF